MFLVIEHVTWLVVAMPILVGLITAGGALGGVALGSRLNRKAARDERMAAEANKLLVHASEILGDVHVVLSDLDPSTYAAYATDESIAQYLDKQAEEASRLRPRLVAVAIRWPDGADDLFGIERYLGSVISELAKLIRKIRRNESWVQDLQPLKDAHANAKRRVEAASDRLVSTTTQDRS